jgi:hypothetical protein
MVKSLYLPMPLVLSPGEVSALTAFVEARFQGNGLAFAGKQYRQVAAAAPGVKVLARFDAGAPAVIERRMGQGHCVFIATFAGLGFHEREDVGTRDALIAGFVRGGYPQLRDIRVNEPTGSGFLCPVVRLLETGEEYLFVIVNRRPKKAVVEITLAESLGLPPRLELVVEGSSEPIRG